MNSIHPTHALPQSNRFLNGSSPEKTDPSMPLTLNEMPSSNGDLSFWSEKEVCCLSNPPPTTDCLYQQFPENQKTIEKVGATFNASLEHANQNIDKLRADPLPPTQDSVSRLHLHPDLSDSFPAAPSSSRPWGSAPDFNRKESSIATPERQPKSGAKPTTVHLPYDLANMTNTPASSLSAPILNSHFFGMQPHFSSLSFPEPALPSEPSLALDVPSPSDPAITSVLSSRFRSAPAETESRNLTATGPMNAQPPEHSGLDYTSIFLTDDSRIRRSQNPPSLACLNPHPGFSGSFPAAPSSSRPRDSAPDFNRRESSIATPERQPESGANLTTVPFPYDLPNMSNDISNDKAGSLSDPIIDSNAFRRELHVSSLSFPESESPLHFPSLEEDVPSPSDPAITSALSSGFRSAPAETESGNVTPTLKIDSQPPKDSDLDKTSVVPANDSEMSGHGNEFFLDGEIITGILPPTPLNSNSTPDQSSSSSAADEISATNCGLKNDLQDCDDGMILKYGRSKPIRNEYTDLSKTFSSVENRRLNQYAVAIVSRYGWSLPADQPGIVQAAAEHGWDLPADERKIIIRALRCLSRRKDYINRTKDKARWQNPRERSSQDCSSSSSPPPPPISATQGLSAARREYKKLWRRCSPTENEIRNRKAHLEATANHWMIHDRESLVRAKMHELNEKSKGYKATFKERHKTSMKNPPPYSRKIAQSHEAS